jgi:ABC-type branched-subunit amino acid transport system ATPase component
MEVMKLDKISVHFGKLAALDDVSMSIESGGRHGLIGPNGAGKTTLFNAVCGYLKPSGGNIYLFGEKATGISPHRYVKKGLARTFQKTNIFLNLSIQDNLLLALDRKTFSPRSFKFRRRDLCEKAEAVLRQFDLLEKKNVPAGFLSYGEQRVLEITLALALEPKILLLDEPTAGLSAVEIAVIKEIVGNLSSNITVITIEHDMDVIFDISDKISVLHHGKVIAEGTVSEIKSNPEVRRIYLGREKE